MPTTDFLSPDSLKKIINESLTGMESDVTNAVVATVDLTGAKIAVAFGKQNGKWRAKAVAQHDWNGDNVVAGSIIVKW